MKKITGCLLMVFLSNAYAVTGQVNLVTVSVDPNHVVPRSLCEATVLNSTQKTFEIRYHATLKNSQNQILLQIIINHITIKPGLNSISRQALEIDQVLFGNNLQAEFVRTKYVLPSGKFKMCCEINSLSGDEVSDDFCDELESDFNSMLTLVYPYDQDTILSSYPVLIWNHNLPFEISVGNGTNYRMIVSKIETDQTPEQAIISNHPVFAQDFLKSHQVQYPFSTEKLEQGNNYAWQVLEFDQALLINKSEVWEFVIAKEPIVFPNKYGIMHPSPEAGFYTVNGDHLLFMFDEEYTTTGNLICSIYDSKRKSVTPEVKDDNRKDAAPNIKKTGNNRYAINLSPYHLKTGLYMLEVKNEKSQVFYLRFKTTF